MNERIKELARMAGGKSTYGTLRGPIVPPPPGWFDQTTVDLEKFVELIVRECFGCIDILEKIADSNNASIPKDYDKHTYLETLDTMRGLLKTHFGVE